MFGHTHSDVFRTALSSKELEPTGTMTVCGSLTTWGGINPSFCVYELDKETLLPIQRKTWSYDIKQANENGSPKWELYTDWLLDYEMSDLSPSSYFDFARRL